MSDETTGGPAFPRVAYELESNVHNDTLYGAGFSGMSLRDYFAAKAMQGFMADPEECPDEGEDVADFYDNVASSAYELADAMLAARKAGGQ